MRINGIQLSWFRGAADPVSLEPKCKSMVVYGVNASGKSSFVDAVEYVINNGRIGHLSHEYSGKHQEKGIPNIHKPKDRKTELSIKFEDDSELKTEIWNDGSHTSSGAEKAAMHNWDYRRTVLRQDEVASFIHDTKGLKYSALLPLLGLHHMEVAAENLRQLAKSVEEQSKLKEMKVLVKKVKTKCKTILGTDSYDQMLKNIERLHSDYCKDKDSTKDVLSRCEELETAINTRLDKFSTDQRRYIVLQAAATLDLKSHIASIRTCNGMLAQEVEPFINEKLDVLQLAETYAGKLGEEKEVKCPACGRTIAADDFKAHISAESERLQEIIKTFEDRKASIGSLCDNINSLKSNLSKEDVKSWRSEFDKSPLADNFADMDGLNIGALRKSCCEEDLITIEIKILPLIDAAMSASKDAPSDVKQLLKDNKTVEVCKALIKAKEQDAVATNVDNLVSFINSLEDGIRKEIRLQSQKVIDKISKDIQSMWSTLHPGESIEEIMLRLPKGMDKAIDIGLKFHGVEQDSPRLTLSEGYRNSLGLCIFLSMAKGDEEKNRPLFLDDVVVSLDREHRGMIAELLEKEFDERQVIILTHDREWYTELRQQLDNKIWSFKALLPYETPNIGIRWSHRTTTFDDARYQLKERPDAAGNDARKILDVELALIAERLRIRMPYLRAHKNDERMAHDFLVRLIADGKKCFQKRISKDYESNTDAIDAFGNADRLLVSWANRASHSFDIVRPEATKLIEACEKALDSFKCSSCKRGVWFADAGGSDLVQCQCGEIRWRYGKG